MFGVLTMNFPKLIIKYFIAWERSIQRIVYAWNRQQMVNYSDYILKQVRVDGARFGICSNLLLRVFENSFSYSGAILWNSLF